MLHYYAWECLLLQVKHGLLRLKNTTAAIRGAGLEQNFTLILDTVSLSMRLVSRLQMSHSLHIVNDGDIMY